MQGAQDVLVVSLRGTLRLTDPALPAGAEIAGVGGDKEEAAKHGDRRRGRDVESGIAGGRIGDDRGAASVDGTGVALNGRCLRDVR